MIKIITNTIQLGIIVVWGITCYYICKSEDGFQYFIYWIIIGFPFGFQKLRMLIDMGALKRVKKVAPFYDGDCVIEDAKCYFSVPKDVIEKCKMKYKGEDAYGLILSNKFIMGLHCICEAARAEYAVDMTITDADTSYKKVMALYNIKEVIFQCLLLDDVKEEEA